MTGCFHACRVLQAKENNQGLTLHEGGKKILNKKKSIKRQSEINPLYFLHNGEEKIFKRHSFTNIGQKKKHRATTGRAFFDQI